MRAARGRCARDGRGGWPVAVRRACGRSPRLRGSRGCTRLSLRTVPIETCNIRYDRRADLEDRVDHPEAAVARLERSARPDLAHDGLDLELMNTLRSATPAARSPFARRRARGRGRERSGGRLRRRGLRDRTGQRGQGSSTPSPRPRVRLRLPAARVNIPSTTARARPGRHARTAAGPAARHHLPGLRSPPDALPYHRAAGPPSIPGPRVVPPPRRRLSAGSPCEAGRVPWLVAWRSGARRRGAGRPGVGWSASAERPCRARDGPEHGARRGGRARPHRDRGSSPSPPRGSRGGRSPSPGWVASTGGPRPPRTPRTSWARSPRFTGALLADAVGSRRGDPRRPSPPTCPRLAGTPAGPATLRGWPPTPPACRRPVGLDREGRAPRSVGDAKPYAGRVNALLAATEHDEWGRPAPTATPNLGVALLGHALARGGATPRTGPTLLQRADPATRSG